MVDILHLTLDVVRFKHSTLTYLDSQIPPAIVLTLPLALIVLPRCHPSVCNSPNARDIDIHICWTRDFAIYSMNALKCAPLQRHLLKEISRGDVSY